MEDLTPTCNEGGAHQFNLKRNASDANEVNLNYHSLAFVVSSISINGKK